jgi:DNA polymerase-3 subunit epsilon
LPIVYANSQEAAAHETVMTEIDKSSKGKTVWRTL